MHVYLFVDLVYHSDYILLHQYHTILITITLKCFRSDEIGHLECGKANNAFSDKFYNRFKIQFVNFQTQRNQLPEILTKTALNSQISLGRKNTLCY